jgi:hypothetical protein
MSNSRHKFKAQRFPSGKAQIHLHSLSLWPIKNALSIPKLKWKYTFQNHHKFQSNEKFPLARDVLHMFTACEDGRA